MNDRWMIQSRRVCLSVLHVGVCLSVVFLQHAALHCTHQTDRHRHQINGMYIYICDTLTASSK